MGFQWDSNPIGFKKKKTWDSTWDSVQQSVGFQMGFRQSNGHICYPVHRGMVVDRGVQNILMMVDKIKDLF